MTSNSLQIVSMLARWPEPGHVKSRLASTIGAEACDRVYRALLRRCASVAQDACRHSNRRLFVFVEPPDRDREMADWLNIDAVVVPQPSGDLGARMREIAADGFQKGASAVILIGSDCPLLTSHRVDEAFDRLASHPVVLGPAADGGYYLIGLSRPVPELFEPLPWGTDAVFDRTVARCRKLGLDPARLDVLPDVDRREDLTSDVLQLLHLTREDIAGD